MISWTTPDLCDQFSDQLQIMMGLQFRNFGGQKRFTGPAVTVKCFEDNSVVKAQVQEPGHGAVLVVDGGGSLRCALLGDQLAAKAASNGWSGLVIYGAIRDCDEIAQTDLGVQALGVVPIRSVRKDRGDLNIPISFGGASILPGDYIYADNNGVLVAKKDLLLS